MNENVPSGGADQGLERNGAAQEAAALLRTAATALLSAAEIWTTSEVTRPSAPAVAPAAVTAQSEPLIPHKLRPSEALASIERALEINPVFAKAHVNRANALLEIGRFDEALAAAERGLELDGDLAGGYAARATSLAQLGHLNEARDCIRRGLERLPESRLLLEARRVFN